MNKRAFYDARQEDFLKDILTLRTVEEAEKYFLEIFTQKELDRVCARKQILRLLAKKAPQYMIAGLVGVGIGTVTRMSLHIQRIRKEGAGEGT